MQANETLHKKMLERLIQEGILTSIPDSREL